MTFLHTTTPLEGQFSGGSTQKVSPPSDGVFSSRDFKRAIAPMEVSSVVQLSTSLNKVVFATSMMLSATPTCAPDTCARKTTTKVTTLVAIPVAKRSKTTLSHLWRHRRRNSGRCDSSILRVFWPMTALAQPNARMVSSPSTW